MKKFNCFAYDHMQTYITEIIEANNEKMAEVTLRQMMSNRHPTVTSYLVSITEV